NIRSRYRRDTMERRTKVWVMLGLVSMLLVGVVLGGLVGGGLSYYLARQQPAAAQAALPLAQPIANIQQPAPTAAPAPNSAPAAPPVDGTVVAAVKQVSPAVVTVINTLDPQAQPNEFQRIPLPFPFPGQGQPQPDEQQPRQPARASGSGVIISQDG